MMTKHNARLLVAAILGLGALVWTGATMSEVRRDQVGRFQMVAAPYADAAGGVYVLDTATGTVTRLRALEPGKTAQTF